MVRGQLSGLFELLFEFLSVTVLIHCRSPCRLPETYFLLAAALRPEHANRQSDILREKVVKEIGNLVSYPHLKMRRGLESLGKLAPLLLQNTTPSQSSVMLRELTSITVVVF